MRYVFTEAWRQYKIFKKHSANKTFADCLKNIYPIARKLNATNCKFYTNKN